MFLHAGVRMIRLTFSQMALFLSEVRIAPLFLILDVTVYPVGFILGRV